MTSKLVRNRARCKRCNDIVESKHVHDCRSCRCGAMFVDGGISYTRRGFSGGDFDEVIEELSEYEAPSLIASSQ